jgi:AcrR family transcriptional regulator
MAKVATPSETRTQILRAALKCFAHSGYASASVQQIVSDAKVSKPTLYYYFKDKAELFQALVHESHDQKLQLMKEATARATGLRARLVEILTSLFDYYDENRELVRISLATAFASPGELPTSLRYADKCERNFEFVHSLMKSALQAGELRSQFTGRELAFGFYGQANAYLMANLMAGNCRLNRATAERVVELFLTGAGAVSKTASQINQTKK